MVPGPYIVYSCLKDSRSVEWMKSLSKEVGKQRQTHGLKICQQLEEKRSCLIPALLTCKKVLSRVQDCTKCLTSAFNTQDSKLNWLRGCSAII